MDNSAYRYLMRVVLGIMIMIPGTLLSQSINTAKLDDAEVVKNSIIVWNSDHLQKSTSTTFEREIQTLKTDYKVTISKTLPRFNIEEWSIQGDMKNALEKLNNVPGIKAFPNYVFQREKAEVKPLKDSDLHKAKLNYYKNLNDKLGDGTIQSTDDGLNLFYEETFDNSDVFAGNAWESFDLIDDEVHEEAWILDSFEASDSLLALYNSTGEKMPVSVTLYSDTLFHSFTEDHIYDLMLSFEANVDLSIAEISLYRDSEFFGTVSLNPADGPQFIIPLNAFNADTLMFDLTVEAADSVEAGELVATLDDIVAVEYPTNDPLMPLQYALFNDGSFQPGYSVPGADIDAIKAWEINKGSSDAIVAVFDDGVDFSHPDLAGNAWVNPGEDVNGDGIIDSEDVNGIDDDGNGFVDDFHGWSTPFDDNSYVSAGSYHGTHVAGIIGADGGNFEGITGVSQDVSMINVMIFNEYGGTTALDIIEGYDYISALLENGVEVTAVNQSWGGGRYMLGYSDQRFIDVMTEYAWHHNEFGTLWVVSAGNSQIDRDNYPFYSIPNNIQSPNVVTVASTDDADNLSGFSDYGKYNVDIGAPGSYILSTLPFSFQNTYYGFLSGTSMAAPQVTGALALARAEYPDESGDALVARLLAVSEDIGLSDWYNEGKRLNAGDMLAVNNQLTKSVSDEVSAFADLAPSHATAKVRKTFLDPFGTTVIGFVNNSGGSVDVTDVSFGGGENSSFDTYYDPATTTVEMGEAYGIPVVYVGDGSVEELAETATITTSGGDVTINILAQEQPYGYVSIYPWYTEEGVVARGDTITTSFTIDNTEGTGTLGYSLEPLLIYDDESEMDVALQEAGESVRSIDPNQVKPKRSLEELNQMIIPRVKEELSNVDRKSVELKPSEDYGLNEMGYSYLFMDDMEDAANVSENWTMMSFGDTEGYFERFDVATYFDPTADSDNVLLSGDFDFGYENSVTAVAASPIFDFSNLKVDGEPYIPAGLEFNYAVLLESGWDFFYVNVLENGSRIATIAVSEDELINDGSEYWAWLDISDLAGKENIEFWFIMNTDGIGVGGFGAYFDDVGISMMESPYVLSSNGGEIAAGETETIEVDVKTGLIPAGDYILSSMVYTNSVNQPGMSGWHDYVFNSRDTYIGISPEYAEYGDALRSEDLVFDYTLTNKGATSAEGTVVHGLTYNNPDYDNWFDGGGEPEKSVNKDKAPAPFNYNRTRAALESPFRQGPNALTLNKSTRDKPFKSRVIPSIQEASYFEDFESGTLSEDWIIEDYSLGLGDVFEVVEITSDEESNHTLFVGNPDVGVIHHNTYTIAETPLIDVSKVQNDELAFLEFGYSAMVEAGYDFFSVWFGYQIDGDMYYEMIANTEANLMNDGNVHFANFQIPQFAGLDSISVSFVVETDGSVYSNYVGIDEISVQTSEKVIYSDQSTVSLAAGESSGIQTIVRTNYLYSGYYSAFTAVDYYNDMSGEGDFNIAQLDFRIPNNDVVANDDTLGIISGDVVHMQSLAQALLGNDEDADSEDWLEIVDMTEPLRGSFKQLDLGSGDGWYEVPDMYYVAPSNFTGVDMFKYVVTDGFSSDTATAYIVVTAEPEFMQSAQQQFTVLEDESFTLSGLNLASGLGGLDKDLMVWASSESSDMTMSFDPSNHTVTATPSENYWGSAEATFYLGYEGNPMDSMMVSFVVVPVNDAPVASFTFDQDDNTLSFSDASNDRLDPEGAIAKWAWDFGDGSTSESSDPTHVYTEIGTYTVTLEVTDNAGATAEFTSEVEVDIITSNETEMNLPDKFALEQNYPNPFNPSTQIAFDLPNTSEVSLEVFSMLGQKVASLISSQSFSAGNHIVSFDARALSSGMYIYRIQAKSSNGKVHTAVKKMTLIK